MSGGRKTEELQGPVNVYFDSFSDVDNTLLSAHTSNSGATYAHAIDNGGDIRIDPVGDLRGQGIVAGNQEVYSISALNARSVVVFTLQLHRYTSITGEWRAFLDFTDVDNYVMLEIKNVDAAQLSMGFVSRVAGVSTASPVTNKPHALGDNHLYQLRIDGTTANWYQDGIAVDSIAYAGPTRTGRGAIGTAHGTAAATGAHPRSAQF